MTDFIQGQIVTAAQWNELAQAVNKIWGPTEQGGGPTADPVRKALLKYGWGQTPTAQIAVAGNKVTSSLWNSTIDIVNISAHNTGALPLATNLSRTAVGQLITAQQAQALKVLNSLVDTNKNNLVSARKQFATLGTTSRTTPWKNKISATVNYQFGSFDQARWFFNSGGQLRLHMTASGGSGRGYQSWQTVYGKLGTFVLDVNTSSNTGTYAVSENKGFYDLSSNEILLMTASSAGGISLGSICLFFSIPM